MTTQNRITILSILLCLALVWLSYITTTDQPAFIGALQAIILAATFGVIWWYTSETQKIREATYQQNQIMGDQLRVMQETSAQQIQLMGEQLQVSRENSELQSAKEKSVHQPIFRPAGYSCARNEANVKFKNLGAVIKNISIEVSPTCEFSWFPSNLATNEELVVNLKKLDGSDADFNIKILFDDQLNHRGSKTFIWQRDRGTKELL